MKAILWFRRDLRIRDNVTLVTALEKFDEVYPVYVFNNKDWSNTILGFPKTGAFRTKFILESVNDLRENLRSLGSDLQTFVGDPAKILVELARKLGVSHVMATRECTHDEILLEEQVERSLWKSGIALNLIWQHTVYHLEDLPFPIAHLPITFTDFRKVIEKECAVRSPVPAPEHMKPTIQNNSPLPEWNVFGLTPPDTSASSAYPFKGGESNAWIRLKEYFWNNRQLSHYKETRNGMIGTDFSSKFSAFLALGCISPRSIYHEIRKYEERVEKNDSTYWLLFELMWRDFFQFNAKKFGSRIFHVNGFRDREVSFQQNQDLFKKWCMGETGEHFVDANMKELLQTGYMSNRGRQNVASYLINDLKIKWTWGAQWFESLLIDYDPASNWGNWCYLAGVGNDPRKDRYFNIKSQAERYDPNGKYVDLWLNRAEAT